jgi:glycosyltransferase involved in cell wall biosynthesis
MPEISIALATCNGARFITKQLDSLAAQTMLPVELVVADDASKDDTVAAIENFARHTPFPVHLRCNKRRVGVQENFGHAIAACAGEIIALADQDDVWFPDKLEKLAMTLGDPSVLAAFSNADVVDENLAPLGYTMWSRIHFSDHEQARMRNGEGFSILLKHHVVTGATLAFKTSLRDKVLPIPEEWPHDAWLALIAAAQGNIVALPEKLVAYRQHSGNVIGGRRRNFLTEAQAALALDRADWYRRELCQWRELASRLGRLAPSTLAEKIAHLEVRAGLPRNRWQRLPVLMREIISGRYARYARNWGSVGIDLFVK